MFGNLIWKIFINNNFFFYKVKPESFDKINKASLFKQLKYNVFVKWILMGSFYLLFLYIFLKFRSNAFMWGHLSCNNFKVGMVLLLILSSIFFIYFLFMFSFNSIPVSVDFCFSIANIVCIVTLLYYLNTTYSMIFLIETISILLFYKFVVSKIWYKDFDEKWDINNKKFDRNLPVEFLDMLFFQFWATFFSTILLFISTLLLLYIFNSTDWINLYYFFQINLNRGYFNNSLFFTFTFIPILFAIFFKLGLSPLHLYKIEIYQGLPLKTVFFYTTYFFLTFVNFFCFFFMALVNYGFNTWFLFLLTILFVGIFSALSLMFDVKFAKAFFAYSTVINVLISTTVVISYLGFF